MHVWIMADVPHDVPGGMRRHMELHALGLERLGHRATILLRRDMHAPAFAAVQRRLPGMSSVAALLQRYRAERPDVINVHTLSAPAWIAARRAGLVRARVVVMSYAADEPALTLQKPTDLLRWTRLAVPARGTFPRADGIWCVNQQDVEFYVEVYHVVRERIRRFPHAVADAFYERDRAVDRSMRRLLFVGTWIRRKGNDVLSAALERVVRQHPDVEVVLAGTLVGEARVLADLGAETRRRVRVLDRAGDDELGTLYRSSSLLLVPSRREGLPISMLEAMACGCPVLAAANSGMLDLLEPGKNGWLEVSFDPVAWAERISGILRDPGALQRASEAARVAAEQFRVTRVAGSVIAWYDSLLTTPALGG